MTQLSLSEIENQLNSFRRGCIGKSAPVVHRKISAGVF
jgi:hypothetical protein